MSEHARQRQKTYLRTFAPSKNSDQPAHSRSLIRIFTGRVLGAAFSSCGEVVDQTTRKRRAIGVFVGRPCQKVYFLTLRLISYRGAFKYKCNCFWINNICIFSRNFTECCSSLRFFFFFFFFFSSAYFSWCLIHMHKYSRVTNILKICFNMRKLLITAYSRTSMARTPLGLWKIVRAMGSSKTRF